MSSQSDSKSVEMCDVINIVRFSSCAIYSRSKSRISFLASTSSPAVGSSKINKSALWLIAVSTLSFAFIPVENSFNFFFRGSFKASHFWSKKSFWKSGYILARICQTSSTVNCELKPASVKDTPIFCFTVAGSSPPSLPNTQIFPASGFTSPSISLIAVLFPAPFFPTNPVILPSGISKDSSSSKSLYFFRTFCIVIIIRLSISHQV